MDSVLPPCFGMDSNPKHLSQRHDFVQCKMRGIRCRLCAQRRRHCRHHALPHPRTSLGVVHALPRLGILLGGVACGATCALCEGGAACAASTVHCVGRTACLALIWLLGPVGAVALVLALMLQAFKLSLGYLAEQLACSSAARATPKRCRLAQCGLVLGMAMSCMLGLRARRARPFANSSGCQSRHRSRSPGR